MSLYLSISYIMKKVMKIYENLLYPEKLHKLHDDLPFLPFFKKSKSLLLIYMIKLKMLYT